MIIAGLTVGSAEPVTRMESVSAQEITLLTQDVGLLTENQSVSRFVAYQVFVYNTRLVKHQVAYVVLVVLKITGTKHVGSKMPSARIGTVLLFVPVSVVEGNIPATLAFQEGAEKNVLEEANA